jgi:hypothetical protein
MLKNLYVYLKLNLIFELETIHETRPKILEFGKKMPEVEPEYFEI